MILKSAEEENEPAPLFDEAAKGEDGGDPVQDRVEQATQPDESWREVKLREALHGLTSGTLDKLEDQQLYTVGDLANWTAEDGGRRKLVDIPGIGAATATKVEEAQMAFWQRWTAERAAAIPHNPEVAEPDSEGGEAD